MKSLYEFMRQKKLTDAIRCSLENFAAIDHRDNQDNGMIRHVEIIPLYAISNLYNNTEYTTELFACEER